MAKTARIPRVEKISHAPSLPKGFKAAAPIKNRKLRDLLTGPDITTSGGARSVEIKRPGQASVQYGEVRGEAAGDIADEVENLDAVAEALGFNVKGPVIGISMYSGGEATDDKVSVTAQVFEGGSWAEIRAAVEASGGTLKVTEYFKDDVPLIDFVHCFKRFNVGLFGPDSGVRQLQVTRFVDV
jgi:hypothetical protein